VFGGAGRTSVDAVLANRVAGAGRAKIGTGPRLGEAMAMVSN